MPSARTIDSAATGVTVVYVIGVLLYGVLVIQQLLLSVLVALFGVSVYAAWRYLR